MRNHWPARFYHLESNAETFCVAIALDEGDDPGVYGYFQDHPEMADPEKWEKEFDSFTDYLTNVALGFEGYFKKKLVQGQEELLPKVRNLRSAYQEFINWMDEVDPDLVYYKHHRKHAVEDIHDIYGRVFKDGLKIQKKFPFKKVLGSTAKKRPFYEQEMAWVKKLDDLEAEIIAYIEAHPNR